MNARSRRRSRETLIFPGFGARIQQRIAELGTTRARFITEHAYTEPRFCFWCNDERTPSDFAIILRLARDLDVSVVLAAPGADRGARGSGAPQWPPPLPAAAWSSIAG